MKSFSIYTNRKNHNKKLAAYYYNRADEWGKEVTINYKHEAFPPTVATFDVERGALTGISPIFILNFEAQRSASKSKANPLTSSLVNILSAASLLKPLQPH